MAGMEAAPLLVQICLFQPSTTKAFSGPEVRSGTFGIKSPPQAYREIEHRNIQEHIISVHAGTPTNSWGRETYRAQARS
jgi:hypothetical protein